MAIYSDVSNFDTFLTLTLQNYGRKLWQQTFDKNTLLWFVRKNGKVVVPDPGDSIRRPLRYKKSDLVQWYSGLEQLNLAEQEIALPATFEWRFVACPIVIDNTKTRRNRGEAAIVNYLEAQVEAAREAIEDEVDLRLVTTPDTGNTKQMDGVMSFVKTDGTGTHGRLNSATYTWSKNKFLDFNDNSVDLGATFSFALHGLGGWELLYWDCCGSSNAKDAPNLLMVDKLQWAWGMRAVRAKWQILLTNEALQADLGVQNYMFNGATVVWDPNIDASYSAKCVFLNTRYIEWYVENAGEPEFTLDPWQDYRPQQDGRATAFRAMTQIGCVKRAAQGIGFNISNA